MCTSSNNKGDDSNGCWGSFTKFYRDYFRDMTKCQQFGYWTLIAAAIVINAVFLSSELNAKRYAESKPDTDTNIAYYPLKPDGTFDIPFFVNLVYPSTPVSFTCYTSVPSVLCVDVTHENLKNPKFVAGEKFVRIPPTAKGMVAGAQFAPGSNSTSTSGGVSLSSVFFQIGTDSEPFGGRDELVIQTARTAVIAIEVVRTVFVDGTDRYGVNVESSGPTVPSTASNLTELDAGIRVQLRVTDCPTDDEAKCVPVTETVLHVDVTWRTVLANVFAVINISITVVSIVFPFRAKAAYRTVPFHADPEEGASPPVSPRARSPWPTAAHLASAQAKRDSASALSHLPPALSRAPTKGGEVQIELADMKSHGVYSVPVYPAAAANGNGHANGHANGHGAAAAVDHSVIIHVPK